MCNNFENVNLSTNDHLVGYSNTILIVYEQLKRESGIDLLSIPPVRVGEKEEVTYEAATIAVKKALRLNRAVQASDGHWPAENAGPMFFTPPLVRIYLQTVTMFDRSLLSYMCL